MRSPEERAAEMISVGCKEPGGPCFIHLRGPDGEPVVLGPYKNKAVAQESADKVRLFLASVLRQGAGG